MVLMSIKLPSDENVIRSRNENGNCLMNGGSVIVPVKWKRRHVSAVRDFPPGCGPFVRPVNVVVPELEREREPPLFPVNLGCNVGNLENGGAGDEKVELSVETLVNAEVENGDNGHVNEVVVCNNENDVVSDEKAEALVNTEVEDGDNGHANVVSDEMVETLVSTEVINGDNGHVNVVVDNVNNVANGEKLEWTVDSLVNTEMQNGDNGPMNMAVDTKVISLKLKFRRRRVSAVRDFPPFCGINAAVPTEEERARITGNKSCGSEEEAVCVKKMQPDDSSNEIPIGNQDTEMMDVEDKKVEKFETSNKVQNIGQACQELVVYAHDKVLKMNSSVDVDNEDKDLEENARENFLENRPLSMIKQDISNRKAGPKTDFKKMLDGANSSVFTGDKIQVVISLKAPSLCQQENKEKDFTNKVPGNAITSASPKPSTKKKPKIQEKEVSTSPKKSTEKKLKMKDKVVYTGTLEMVVKDEEEDEEGAELVISQGAYDVNFDLLPFFPKSSNDARNKVRETLRYFHSICRKIIQNEESKTDESKSAAAIRRVDLAAKAIMDAKGKTPVLGKKTYGPIPGVEVGDEFLFRVELALLGIHRPFQSGIDYVRQGKMFFAVSVVASGGYDNEIDKPDCLIYSGAGGVGKDKSIGNQKLERGNLALSNNIDLRYPVRVIRGYKVKSTEFSDSKSKVSTMYIYDGLYMVDKCSQVTGPLGNLVYKFELNRIPGQPQLAIREVKSKKFKMRPGIIVNDITDGKEVFRISAINTIDAEKPPSFTYITKIVYPDWFKPVPPKGCDCVGRCWNKKCSCALKNGGEIPYNRNGAIVEAKTLVYECGPSCGCPPSCYNRVTQHGMKIQLEIFKTETRGWGVRSLSSISSGSFICEYIGELLEDTEAEKRTSNDEYLFDIGQNYNDCKLNPDIDDSQEMDGFTIDALNYGNVGRFINHSCSPNLYAQNVLYDQDDKKMPHIMLFAAENIPPLQELTYHYNYAVDNVRDSDGNIKVKNCYCGSPECTGRLY